MKKLAELQNKILSKFGIDKVLHFFGGIIVFLAFMWGSEKLPLDFLQSVLISTAITIVAGILKEYLYDKRMRGGKFDIKDAIATALGAPAGVIIIGIIYVLVVVIRFIV